MRNDQTNLIALGTYHSAIRIPHFFYRFVGSDPRSTCSGGGRSTFGGADCRSSGPTGSARRTSGGATVTGKDFGAGVSDGLAWASCALSLRGLVELYGSLPTKVGPCIITGGKTATFLAVVGSGN